MALAAHKSEGPPRRRRPKATTPEAREAQMIALAFDAVEKRIHEGTASAMELVHLLRLGSTRNSLEEEELRKKNILLEARTDALESQKSVEELYSNALKAMRSYQGGPEDDEDL